MARVDSEMQLSGDGTRLRRMSVHLPKLTIRERTQTFFFPTQVRVTREEVNEQGRELFGHFVQEEVDNEGIQTPQTLLEEIVRTPDRYANPRYAKYGLELRMLADDFTLHKQRERQRIRQRANEVGENLTEDEFQDLLGGLLEGGITKHRILMLFLFCSDVVIHVLRKGPEAGMELARRFLMWSIKFIMDRVCDWVMRHGGWSTVLGNTLKYLQYGFVTLGVGCAGYFVYKKFIQWKS